jgi:GNAT superfamily N-acetyltransferase
MDVTTRPSVATDREFAQRTHHAAYRDVVERQFGTWLEEEQDHFFAAGWGDAAHQIVLCDGTPCGSLGIDEYRDHVGVREIVIAPEFQGRGIDSLVLEHVMERASHRGLPVRLGTFHTNRAAVLY